MRLFCYTYTRHCTGLDSLGAVELSNALASHFALSLSPTFVFDYPTPVAMARHIVGILQPILPVQQKLPAVTVPTTPSLAILAVSHQPLCSHKGTGLPQLDAIRAVPHERCGICQRCVVLYVTFALCCIAYCLLCCVVLHTCQH